jgi:drug/metabolite transporter (DMT)-like permease
MTNHTTDGKQVLDVAAMAILVVLCASWGLQQVAIKVANQGVSPILQAAIRSIGASVLVWIWMAVRREPILVRDGTLWWGIAAGVLFAGEFILVYWGLEYTNASRSVVFLYTSPFVVALGAQIFIPGEHFRRAQVRGLFCAFAGIVVAFGESMGLPTYRMLIGDSMLIGGAVLWGATTVLIKAGPLARIPASRTLMYQLGVSSLVLLLGALAKGEPGVFAMTPVVAASLAYQIVWVAFITYLVWFWLIRHYPASRLASFTFLTPLFGVLAGGALLNEPITTTLLAAVVLVCAGVYLVNRPAGANVSVHRGDAESAE